MKTIPVHLVTLLNSRQSQRNLRLLAQFGATLASLVVVYSVLFHWIMAFEGQDHSWMTGFYWTLTVMSTLGFGDITFASDLGRFFSMVVLLSGILFLLVLLPFTFIQFFYAPWMEAHSAARAPRKLAPDLRGHVLLTRLDEVTASLIKKLDAYRVPYALLAEDLTEGLRLHDEGYRVLVGGRDNPETYKAARVRHAGLVATTLGDEANTNVAFTVRGLSDDVPIITTANREASVDILDLAGATHVLQLHEQMGRFFARRTNAGNTRAHVVGQFDELQIAEAAVSTTPFVGKELMETRLRENVGVTVLGGWRRGQFTLASPQMKIHRDTVLLIAGSKTQIAAYDESYGKFTLPEQPVLIVGAGRVGRATGRELGRMDVPWRILEQNRERLRDPRTYIHGDAASLADLERAGIRETQTAILTAHSDDINIYLTIYLRRLRPDLQIISRCARERNVATLHRAGADFVMSYGTVGANIIFNLLQRSDVLMIAEGLAVLRTPVPASLTGKTIRESDVRQRTGCSIVALAPSNAPMIINPPPDTPLHEGCEMVLIGTVEAESRFQKAFAERRRRG